MMVKICAEAAADPAVVAAKAALDAVEGSHNYEVKAAYEAAFNNANAVRNKYVQQFQATYNNATEQEGKHTSKVKLLNSFQRSLLEMQQLTTKPSCRRQRELLLLLLRRS